MITIATYNILHGYYKNEILDNIKFLIGKNADVICLQEADIPFEEHLNKFLLDFSNWSVRYFHSGKGSNLAVMWNTKKLELTHVEAILLPKPSDDTPRQRAAQVATFTTEGKTLRVSNVHLAWEGGVSHRFVQLQYLKKILSQSDCEHEIIVGDFNTFAPAMFRNIQKRKAQKTLGDGWKNALPDLVWTCDVSRSFKQDNFHLFSTALKRLGFKLRSCLDYVFIKNLRVIKGEMLDLPGSDHRPLLVSLTVE